MKIILGSSAEDVARHAQTMLRAHDRRMTERGEGLPRGVPVGLAKFIHSCDDCGDTFWDSDEYGYSHRNCRPLRRGAGF